MAKTKAQALKEAKMVLKKGVNPNYNFKPIAVKYGKGKNINWGFRFSVTKKK